MEALTETSYAAVGRVRCTAQRMHRNRFSITTDACTQSSEIAADPHRITRSVGRVTEVISGVWTELEALEMTMTYTPRDEIDRLTDGEGNRTWFARDAHGRLVRTYFPLQVRGSQHESYTDYEAYTYDAAGNMLTRRLRDGQVINMSYDQLNRV